MHRLARRERPDSRVANCALVAPESAGELVSTHYAGAMSIVSGARGTAHQDDAYLGAALLFDDGYEVEVPGRTLSELLGEIGSPEVDLLSLDIEGYEAQALRGLDLDRHAPRLILVEVHTDAHLDAVSGVLGDRYRQLERVAPRDVLFERT